MMGTWHCRSADGREHRLTHEHPDHDGSALRDVARGLEPGAEMAAWLGAFASEGRR